MNHGNAVLDERADAGQENPARQREQIIQNELKSEIRLQRRNSSDGTYQVRAVAAWIDRSFSTLTPSTTTTSAAQLGLIWTSSALILSSFALSRPAAQIIREEKEEKKLVKLVILVAMVLVSSG